MLPAIDRVYVSHRAIRELGWAPIYGFEKILAALVTGSPIASPLARSVGIKGYRDRICEDGVYPVMESSGIGKPILQKMRDCAMRSRVKLCCITLIEEARKAIAADEDARFVAARSTGGADRL